MQLTDVIGFMASLLVLLTFCMKDMISLRVVALCSNFAFLTYGMVLHLFPIIVLHGILIPVNACRLAGLQDRTRSRGPTTTVKRPRDPNGARYY